jgi:hypothetical protein
MTIADGRGVRDKRPETLWFLVMKLVRQQHEARCTDDYLDIVLECAQRGDLDPLIEVFENRKGSLRLKPAMLKFVAEVLRRAKKPNKKFPRLATTDRQFEIATFVQMQTARMGLTEAYKKAAERFEYKDTRQIRTIYTQYRKLCMLVLKQIEQTDFGDKEKRAAKRVCRKLGIPDLFVASGS